MTKPEKQDGTMQLDVGQIELLDLPVASTDVVEVPPEDPGEPVPQEVAEPAEPSPEVRVSKGPPPLPAEASSPVVIPPAAISARKLVEGPPAPKRTNQIARFLVGAAAAALICGGLFLAWRFTRGRPAPVVAAPPATPPPVETVATPTRTFTMAPVELTADTTASATSHAAPVGSAKPAVTATTSVAHPRSDDVIKVEN